MKTNRMTVNLMASSPEDVERIFAECRALDRHLEETRRLKKLVLVKRPSKASIKDAAAFDAAVDHALGIDSVTFPVMAGEAILEVRAAFFDAAALAARAVAKARTCKPLIGDAHVASLLAAKLQLEAMIGGEPTKKEVRKCAVVIFGKWFDRFGMTPAKNTVEAWKKHFTLAGLNYLKPDVRGPAARK